MYTCMLHLDLYTIGTIDGHRVAEVQNPAISQELLVKISRWRADGVEWSDIISRLRPRTVPCGYVYSTWKPGEHYNIHYTILMILYISHITRVMVRSTSYILIFHL